MKNATAEVVVDVPVDVAYAQWTQFESFPDFMEGIEEVRPTGGKSYHWTAKIGGMKKEWDAEIIEELPNERIAWYGTGDITNEGTVTFEPVGPDKTRVVLDLGYEPEGVLDKVGDVTGMIRRMVEVDVQGFKEHVEAGGVGNR